MDLETYHDPMNSDWQVFLNRNVNDVQFETDISEIIQNAYVHSAKFYIHGALACVYFLSAIITFLNGLSAFFERVESSFIDTNPYTFILPVAVLVFDLDQRRVYKRSEFVRQTVLKVILWIMFYAILSSAAVTKKGALFKLSNYMMIAYPCLSIVYSFLLYRFKFLSYPINGNQDQFSRFENLIN